MSIDGFPYNLHATILESLLMVTTIDVDGCKSRAYWNSI